MARIGYVRVSTEDQTLDLQRDALRAAGCIDIYEAYASGARATRPELAAALRTCRQGDGLVVWKLDCLGRSLKHLPEIIEDLQHRGVAGERSREQTLRQNPTYAVVQRRSACVIANARTNAAWGAEHHC